MPPGVSWIIGNEAAERFSFYGMRTILVVFMAQYLHLMDGRIGAPMAEAQAKEHYHFFVAMVYFTPLIGAFLSDVLLGKYRTILWLSLLYCAGHASLAMMGTIGQSSAWLLAGLVMICLGAGGIKPCVSSNVGDQFGTANQHLLTRVYNWFYFSINFGSFFSTLLTPWLLEWYGPHWAFGVPGVLMAIATLLFWMGRRKFVHVPPAGMSFFSDLFSREGLVALGKLIPLFVFFAMFWALYDQTASSWVFQAGQMNLNFMGITWLESQVQAINPILILAFIPLFTFIVYPLVNRVIHLTPLRKIGVGFFLVVLSFWLTAVVQSWIDRGETPSIGWQFLCFVIITAAEIMVSIVGLEFAYTQSPKRLKSIIMSLFLLAVFGGNIFTSQINRMIQIPSASTQQAELAVAQLPADWRKSPRTVMLPGFDDITGTADDYIQQYKDGEPRALTIPGQAVYEAAAGRIESLVKTHHGRLPEAKDIADLGVDPWGNAICYETLNGNQFRLVSAGPDRVTGSRWDQGLLVTITPPEVPKATSWLDRMHPSQTWLAKRHAELGGHHTTAEKSSEIAFDRTTFVGGQTKLQGAAYYRFFMWLMLGTSIVFVPYALLYREKTYFQD